jgi:hypothetical protein
LKTKTTAISILTIGMIAAGVAAAVNYKQWWVYPEFHAVASLAYKDPDSVKFRSDSMPNAEVLCGEANAKNGYGAYGGFKRYIATKQGAVYLEGEGLVRPPKSDTGISAAIESMELDITALRLQNERLRARQEQAKSGSAKEEQLSDHEAMEKARGLRFDKEWSERCEKA